MKNVTGGNDPNSLMMSVDGEVGKCAANKDWTLYLATFCGDAAGAIAYAGANGHWCCNCAWAIEQCP